MAFNDVLHVFREIWIDHSRRVFRKCRRDFGQLTTPRLGGAQYGNRLSVTLNYYFCAGLHTIQHRANVARQLRFADV